jgi:hypothetical protein
MMMKRTEAPVDQNVIQKVLMELLNDLLNSMSNIGNIEYVPAGFNVIFHITYP